MDLIAGYHDSVNIISSEELDIKEWEYFAEGNQWMVFQFNPKNCEDTAHIFSNCVLKMCKKQTFSDDRMSIGNIKSILFEKNVMQPWFSNWYIPPIAWSLILPNSCMP